MGRVPCLRWQGRTGAAAMVEHARTSSPSADGGGPAGEAGTFRSAVVDGVRAAGNVWQLPEGRLLLPEVFGFCRGVQRALRTLEKAVRERAKATGGEGGRLVLLGEIIHNPGVNESFRRRGVKILSRAQRRQVERHVGPGDCAVIPAFGVPLEIERRLATIGCGIVDTTCPDVRRVWHWAERAVADGYAVLIFGRSGHDETVVTKSRLAAAGGRYLVVGTLAEARRFAELLAAGDPSAVRPAGHFGPDATNAETLAPFVRLAQVSQTTMLYDETLRVRDVLAEAMARVHGGAPPADALAVQPTVCRATQQRQRAAVRLCEARPDLTVVVGGFGSSNTRHLYELAARAGRACFIEDVAALRSADELVTFDPAAESERVVHGWLPAGRPVSVGVLAGASTPESAVGEVLQRLAGFLDEAPVA